MHGVIKHALGDFMSRSERVYKVPYFVYRLFLPVDDSCDLEIEIVKCDLGRREHPQVKVEIRRVFKHISSRVATIFDSGLRGFHFLLSVRIHGGGSSFFLEQGRGELLSTIAGVLVDFLA